MANFLVLSLFLVLFVGVSEGLECYVCQDQDSNKDKCIKTTIQCEEQEDTCLTYINYKVPPYWTMRGDRIHYVSKNCARLEDCLASKASFATKCKRDWYDDWTCVECCQGDSCNYYVTLGGSVPRFSLATTLLVILVTVLMVNW